VSQLPGLENAVPAATPSSPPWLQKNPEKRLMLFSGRSHPALAQDIAAFLAGNAGAPQRLGADPATPRVTATLWFVRKHAKVPPATWQRPAIGSASNCGACHVEAAAGDFRKRHLCIPP
jgi:hypothetical protein